MLQKGLIKGERLVPFKKQLELQKWEGSTAGNNCWDKQNDCEAKALEAVGGLEEGEGPKERENTLFTSTPETRKAGPLCTQPWAEEACSN